MIMGRKSTSKPTFPPNVISFLRNKKGWTQTELAEKIGTTAQTVGRWELRTRPISSTWVYRLAEAFNCKPSDIFEENAAETKINSVYIIGDVQAGLWKEALEYDQDEWEKIPAILPDNKPYFALRVKGSSMNLLYKEGSVLICLKPIDFGREPKNGDKIVVQRTNPKDGTIEATVKIYEKKEDGTIWLIPKSTEPEFQAPIKINGEYDCEIIGFVIFAQTFETIF
jgi:SOS-response transcriptional repressor LexA